MDTTHDAERRRAPRRRRPIVRAAAARSRPVPTSSTCRNVSLFYGEKQALFDINLGCKKNAVTALHRAVGLRQVDASPLPEPDERPHRRREDRRARSSSTASRHLRARRRTSRDPQALRDGLPEVEPVPEDDLRERRLRPPDPGRSTARASSTRLRAVPPERRPLGRGQGPPRGLGPRPFRRPDAAHLHRARDRRRARDPPDGRALLGARPDRDEQGRGAHLRAQGALHDRDRDAQHAAGRARLGRDRASSCSASSSSSTRPRRSSRSRARRRPRTTSRGGSDDAKPPAPPLPRRRGRAGPPATGSSSSRTTTISPSR